MNKDIIDIENKDYIVSKDEENNEILTRKIKMGNKVIDLVIKNGDEENNEGINKLITKVLGDLYVEKMLEKL